MLPKPHQCSTDRTVSEIFADRALVCVQSPPAAQPSAHPRLPGRMGSLAGHAAAGQQPAALRSMPAPGTAWRGPQAQAAYPGVQPHVAYSSMQPHSAHSSLQPQAAYPSLHPHAQHSSMHPGLAASAMRSHAAPSLAHNAGPRGYLQPGERLLLQLHFSAL